MDFAAVFVNPPPYVLLMEQRPAAYEQFVTETKGAAPGDQMEAVNAFVNAKPYRRDRHTPKDFLKAGGNCVDSAKMKFTMMVELGWSPPPCAW